MFHFQYSPCPCGLAFDQLEVPQTKISPLFGLVSPKQTFELIHAFGSLNKLFKVLIMWGNVSFPRMPYKTPFSSPVPLPKKQKLWDRCVWPGRKGGQRYLLKTTWRSWWKRLRILRSRNRYFVRIGVPI